MARKPIPTHLKLLSGNPGKRPLNTDEPVVKQTLKNTKPPKELSAVAKKMWVNTLDNSPEDLLKVLDFTELMRFCVSYDLYLTALKNVQKYGAVVVNEKGFAIESPWVKIMNKQSEIMAASGSNLGFSPVSRTRIRMTMEKPKESKFSNLENKRDIA